MALADDTQWKNVNYQILLRSRHSDAEVGGVGVGSGVHIQRETERFIGYFFMFLYVPYAPLPSTSSGTFLLSVDADGAGLQTEGELHGAAARDHPLSV